MPAPSPSKPHDCLFKWAISAFIGDFFTLFFPKIQVLRHRLLDKEFYQGDGERSTTTAADLSVLLEVQTPEDTWEMIILIEMKSRREDATAQLRDYLLRSGIVHKFPVWPVVIYTDPRRWRKYPPNGFVVAYTYQQGKIEINYDIIKLSDLPSQEMLAKGSMLGTLFALCGNPMGLSREALVTTLCETVHFCQDSLTGNQKLLIDNFLNTYSGVSPERLSQIKEQKHMYYAPTIEAHMEYVKQQGRQEGMLEIIARLEAMGRISKEDAASMVMEATAPVVIQEAAPKRSRKSSKRTT